MAKVMRKEARHTQRRDRASGVSLDIFENIFNSFKIICIRSWHSLVSLLPVSGKSTIFSTFLFEKISLLHTLLYPTYLIRVLGTLEWGPSCLKTAQLGLTLLGAWFGHHLRGPAPVGPRDSLGRMASATVFVHFACVIHVMFIMDALICLPTLGYFLLFCRL